MFQSQHDATQDWFDVLTTNGADIRASGTPDLALRRCPVRAYSSKRLKTRQAFWPPKPKPLDSTVSTRWRRATLGT